MGAAGLLLLAALQGGPLANIPTNELVRWGACTGEQIVALDRPSLSPDEVALAALAACRAEEEAVLAAERRLASTQPSLNGADYAAIEVAGMRERARIAWASRIAEARGLPATADTTATRGARLGACLGDSARARARGPESPDSIADAALRDCAAEERRVAESAPPSMSRADLAAAMAAVREQMRAQLLRIVAEARGAE